MFRGYGYFDHNLFAGVTLESIDGFVFPQMEGIATIVR